MGVGSPNVPSHQQSLASGATSCVSRNRDRSPEGTAVWWTGSLGLLFWSCDIRGILRKQCLNIIHDKFTQSRMSIKIHSAQYNNQSDS